MFFFFKQKTAYEMRISDWSSDLCSSDLVPRWNKNDFFGERFANRWAKSVTIAGRIRIGARPVPELREPVAVFVVTDGCPPRSRCSPRDRKSGVEGKSVA